MIETDQISPRQGGDEKDAAGDEDAVATAKGRDG
jgi:hypothetical protein